VTERQTQSKSSLGLMSKKKSKLHVAAINAVSSAAFHTVGHVT